MRYVGHATLRVVDGTPFYPPAVLFVTFSPASEDGEGSTRTLYLPLSRKGQDDLWLLPVGPVEEAVTSIALDPHMIRWRDVDCAVWTASPEDLLWAVASFIPSAVYADWLAARRKDDERWRDEVRQVVGILRDERLARLEREAEAR